MDEMTDKQRVELGKLIRERRAELFDTKIAAYQAAELNPATWARLEAGQTVRPDRLRAAVRTLWPASLGDWRRIDRTIPSRPRPALGTQSEPDYLIRVEGWITSLEARIESLEAWRAEHDDDE